MKARLREWCLRVWGTLTDRHGGVEEELSCHLQMAAEEALRRGTSVREARLRAGGLAQASDAVREQSAIAWLRDFFRDSRHGLRLLAKKLRMVYKLLGLNASRLEKSSIAQDEGPPINCPRYPLPGK